MSKRLLIGFIGFLVILGASWALIRPEFFRVHDYIHAARIAEFSKAWAEGHIPVRWSSNFGYGYGMPLFQFYAPLPYAVGAVIWSTGLSIVTTIKILYVISTILIFIGSFKFGKELYGTYGGIIAASLATLAPYRAVNLYIRGALSESWAMSFFPWILLGMYLVVKGKTNGWITLTLSVAAIVLSHNISLILMAPFVAMYAMYILIQLYFNPVNKNAKLSYIWQKCIALCTPVLLAIGISSFYVIPSFFEKQHTKVDSAILGGYFDFNVHFLYIRQLLTPQWSYGGSQWGPDDGISFFIGLASIFAITMIVIKVMYTYRFSLSIFVKKNKDIIFWFGLVVIGFWATTFKAQWLWQTLDIFEYLQFPWRFFSPTVVLLSFAIASSVTLFASKWSKFLFASSICLIALSSQSFYFQPEAYLNDADSFYYTDPTRIRSQMSSILPDYIPANLTLESPPEMFFTPQLEFTSHLDRTHQKLISYTLSQPGMYQAAIADFPGWTAEIDGKSIEQNTSDTGLIEVYLPEGSHTLSFHFANTPIRNVADSISGLSIIVFIGLLYRQHHMEKNK
ncbi:MAG: hypothetical protein WAU07_04475 [Microgenomates group bacterium]